jgi:hypothetical protein
VPGPQENFEFEFQVPPPVCPTSPTAQIKAPNRTIPTMLDRYEMALKLPADQAKRQMEIGKDASGSTSVDSTSPARGKQAEISTGKAWISPEGWMESNRADYERQLRVLDQQNKLKLQVEKQRQDAGSSTAQSVWTCSGIDGNQQNSAGPVSGSVWSPPPGWEESLEPKSREALDYLRKAVTGTRTSMMKEPTPELKRVWAATSSNIPEPYPQRLRMPQMGEQHTTQADYQIQLILLVEQNKKRLMKAKHKQEAMFEQRRQSTLETTPADRESSVDSVWSAQFTPESTPGFPESASMHIKYECGERPTGLVPCHVQGGQYNNFTASVHNLQDYELQLAMLEQQKQASLMRARTSTSHALNGPYQECEQDPTQKSRKIEIEGEVIQRVGLNTFQNLEKRKAGQPAHQPLIEQQEGIKAFDFLSMSQSTIGQQQNRQSSTGELTATSEAPNWSPREYQQELFMNKARQQHLRATTAAAERAGDFIALQLHHSSNTALEDQYKETNSMLRAWEERNQGPASMLPSNGSHSLQDYQMQLILVEQQNRRRLMMARQDQESLQTRIPPSNGNHALQDLQMQLMLLEHQNKKRLMMIARQEEALAVRNVKQRTESISLAEHTDEGATWDSGPCVAGGSQADILHNKPLVFRGRPTCDD